MRAPEINNQQKAGSLSTEESERFYSGIENINMCDHLDALRYSLAAMPRCPEMFPGDPFRAFISAKFNIKLL